MVNLPFFPSAIRGCDSTSRSPELEVLQLSIFWSAYSLELGSGRKVAGRQVADFSHPAWNQPVGEEWVKRERAWTEYKFEMLSPDVVVMTHRGTTKGVQDGKEVTESHRSLHVFQKKDGRWQVVANAQLPIAK
jgi:hypothetical protein